MIEISSLLCTGTSLRDNSLTSASTGATLTWGLTVICYSGVIDITLFLFLRIVSLKLIGLPRFNRGLGSFDMLLYNFLLGFQSSLGYLQPGYVIL